MGKVELKRENGLSIIQFNRPETYNALDVDAINQLKSIIEEVKTNDDKVVILTGKGKAFSSGGDVSMMTALRDESLFFELMDALNTSVAELYTLNKIVISAVNGTAVGLGLSLALNADYVIANDQAKFGMLFAGIALIPDGGGHFFLEQRMGAHKAKQFIWGLEQVQGKKAQAMNLVDVLTEGDALEAAKQYAQKLQAAPIITLLRTKEILHEEHLPRLKTILEKEKEGQLAVANTKDHREGVTAFLEKREPQFIGE